MNTEKQDKTVLDNRTMITVERIGNYRTSTDNQIKNEYVYSGIDNPMTMSRVYSTKWLCGYEMMSYPFDTQVPLIEVHPVHLTVNKGVEL